MFRIGVQSIAMNGEINLFMRRGVCPPQEMDQFLTLYMNHPLNHGNTLQDYHKSHLASMDDMCHRL